MSSGKQERFKFVLKIAAKFALKIVCVKGSFEPVTQEIVYLYKFALVRVNIIVYLT